jgi:hypothetical protein
MIERNFEQGITGSRVLMLAIANLVTLERPTNYDLLRCNFYASFFKDLLILIIIY